MLSTKALLSHSPVPSVDDKLRQWRAKLAQNHFRFEQLDDARLLNDAERVRVLSLLQDRCLHHIESGQPVDAWQDAIAYQKLAPSTPDAMELLGRTYEARVLYRSALITYKRALRSLEEKYPSDTTSIKRHRVFIAVEPLLRALVTQVKDPDSHVYRASTEPLYAPPAVQDHHRGGSDSATELSIYWDCLKQRPSSEDAAKFDQLHTRELRRNLTVAASPALYLAALKPKPPGRLHFPRLTLVKSVWEIQDTTSEESWQKTYVKKQLAKFGLSCDPSTARLCERYHYYQMDHFLVDVLVCDTDGLLSNSDPIAFQAGEGDQDRIQICTRVVSRPTRAQFDAPSSAAASSLSDFDQSPTDAASSSPPSAIAMIPHSRWLTRVAFLVNSTGAVTRITHSLDAGAGLSNDDNQNRVFALPKHLVEDAEINERLEAAVGSSHMAKLREELLQGLSEGEKSELESGERGWLDKYVEELCRLREERVNSTAFSQAVRPAFADPIEASVRQEVAMLCGVVMEIGDTQLVRYWTNRVCPIEWREHVSVFEIPSTAQPPVIAATPAAASAQTIPGVVGRWTWDEFPHGADDLSDEQRLFWCDSSATTSSTQTSSTATTCQSPWSTPVPSPMGPYCQFAGSHRRPWVRLPIWLNGCREHPVWMWFLTDTGAPQTSILASGVKLLRKVERDNSALQKLAEKASSIFQKLIKTAAKEGPSTKDERPDDTATEAEINFFIPAPLSPKDSRCSPVARLRASISERSSNTHVHQVNLLGTDVQWIYICTYDAYHSRAPELGVGRISFCDREEKEYETGMLAAQAELTERSTRRSRAADLAHQARSQQLSQIKEKRTPHSVSHQKPDT